MARKISVNVFDIKSIREAKKQYEDYKRRLDDKFNAGLEDFAKKCVEIVRKYIVTYDAVEAKNLYESISYDISRAQDGTITVRIFTEDEAALFVEFGTGVVGAENPYVDKTGSGIQAWPERGYDSENTTGMGWFYFDDERGRFRFTLGMPSRPFMTDSAIEIAALAQEFSVYLRGV